jgi:hypothetical protein
MKDFIARVGTFFLLLGVGFVLLFVASDASTNITTTARTDYNLLCGGVMLLSVGFLFRRTAAPPQAADRFKFIKKIQAQREAAKKEKAKAQQQKK